jgi:hypothetical protein
VPLFGGFDHIDVRVPALAPVEAFYDALMPALGLPVKRLSHVDAGGDWHDADAEHPYNTVEYFEPDGTQPNAHFIGFIEDRAMRPNATRIAFRIGAADLERLRSLLQGLGARNVDDVTATTYPALFFEDPGGTRLELIIR